jgi:hypothetical protein
MKTSDLIGPALDWAVAKCEGYDCQFDDTVSGPWLIPQEGYLHDEKPLTRFNPSKNWNQGGPIIERENIKLDVKWSRSGGIWYATIDTIAPIGWWSGQTPLIAAMRCYVASKLGDEIEIPSELQP